MSTRIPKGVAAHGEFMALFSALTVAMFFFALWLLPEQPFIPFLLPRFPGFF